MLAINPIQDRRFRIERHVAAYRHRHLLCIPNVARSAKCVRADTKRRVIIRDSQQSAITRPQQFVLVHQLEPSVQIILVYKVNGRFESVTIQIMSFAGVARVIASPDKRCGPVASPQGRLYCSDAVVRRISVVGSDASGLRRKP